MCSFTENYLGVKTNLDVKADVNMICVCCSVMKMANILLGSNKQEYFIIRNVRNSILPLKPLLEYGL